MKENQNNHYFNEWWKSQAKRYARLKGVRIEDFVPAAEVIWRTDYSSRGHREPAPIFMMEWAKSNPFPVVTRDEFIVALAKRVERLESALAEKGGSR